MFFTYPKFFLLTLDDLRSRLNKNTEYDLIRACGLCRQLILDKLTLYDLANKDFDINDNYYISYEPAFHYGYDRGNVNHFVTGWMTINPIDTKDAVTLGRKEFKSIVLITEEKYSYTVEDIIEDTSHFMGGVHSKDPHEKNKKLKVLYGLYSRLKEEANLPLFAIRAVCAVIVKAMEPLELAIKEHTHAVGR